MAAKDKSTKKIKGPKKPKKPKKAKKTTRRRQPQKAGVIQNVKINIGGSGAEGVGGIPQYKINEATRNMLRPSGQAPPPPQEVVIRHLQPQQAPLTSAFSQNNMSQQAQQPLGSVNGSIGQSGSSFTNSSSTGSSSIGSSSIGSTSTGSTMEPTAQERASIAAQERARDNYVNFNEPSIDGSIAIRSFGSSIQDDDVSVLSNGSESGFLDDRSISITTDFSKPHISASVKTYNAQQPLEEAENEQVAMEELKKEVQKHNILFQATYDQQQQLEDMQQKMEEAQVNAEFAAGAQLGEMQQATAESSPQEPEAAEEPDFKIRVKPTDKHQQNVLIDDPKDGLKKIKVAKLDVLKAFARSQNDDELSKMLVEGGGGLPSGIGKLLLRKYPNLNLPLTRTGGVQMNAIAYNTLANEV